MPPMSVLIKPASGNCNMKCDYCFYCDEQNKRSISSFGIMSDHTLKNIMRKTILHSEGFCSIAFQGGEPTLAGIDFFRNITQYEKHYNRKHIRVEYALQTNGLNINEEWCRFFKENHFLIGLSVDGIQDIHDKYRHTKSGNTTYEQIIRAAGLLDQYGVDYNVLTVVHGEVAGRIDEIYDFYKNKGWHYQQYIACLDPLYEKPGKYEYSLLPAEYGKFLVKLFDRWFCDLEMNQQPFIRQFENYIGILLGRMAEACDQRGTCGIQYVVEADGSVYPCDFYMLDEYKLGNMNDTTIAVMDEKRKEIRFIEESFKLTQECKQCEFYGICRGGCQRSRLKTDNEMYKNYLCEGYKEFFEKCLPKMVQIADMIKKSN
ncbi:anaerobic sulfatase maturase [Anaerocolumna sedimenticola]|uniref:Anaerobic sulfatase maturase n=1 Tax=Anaerocolumna sedimenticola TaxID=2696063 RepID=A0A6P1TKQ8_9FIRM|nr:anaerobic sulfatase maturase [Anaerocolumna sedimenticola]QHQ60877.1 anaerobic sulfatase maturase [Anaerocolumna sedimenticola]